MPLSKDNLEKHELMLTKMIEMEDELVQNYNALKSAHELMEGDDVIGMNKKALNLCMIAYSHAMANIQKVKLERRDAERERVARIRESN